mgnify:CR=1 FL=1
MLPEHEDKRLRAALAVDSPTPAPWLASRIVANATAQPQNRGLLGFIERAFSEWDYALNMKGAALAAFALLGILSAEVNPAMASQPMLDVTTIGMADPNWTEEL